MYKAFGNITCDYCETEVSNIDFIVIKSNEAVEHYCSEKCKNKNNKLADTVFSLHAGTWDSHHLIGIFSSRENAEAYVKKFVVSDSPKIEEIPLNPLMYIVESNKNPYMIHCKKKGKIHLKKADVHSHFQEDNVHFTWGEMYYFILAENDKEATEMGEKMRTHLIDKDWETNTNLGIQII